jgi:hypothetical protein
MSSGEHHESGGLDGANRSGSSHDISDGIPGRHRCVDCKSDSPPTNTDFTLISTRFGWRLHRERDAVTGRWNFEWRCPKCWEAFRGRQGADR